MSEWGGEERRIDPVHYGMLWQQVQSMDQKVNQMAEHVEQLLELANKSKGGFWFGMTVVSGTSVIVGYLIHVISLWRH